MSHDVAHRHDHHDEHDDDLGSAPAPTAAEVRTARGALVTVPRADARARDAGMATAEYAMATLAACGFAGLLIAILRSAEVKQLLLGVIRQALALG